eukprot:TRINITY_DN56173_c0_g1_i1.p1 TRINITY_DN56173_c0_g1~~TRINITY_DN56173_c0_g1_i1.p1  ORF type:complete len:198 (+),score=43.37 TRINITY_DN56173_c0_g1_i1:61-594(+)
MFLTDLQSFGATVKNTFIHVDVRDSEESLELRRSASSPGLLQVGFDAKKEIDSMAGRLPCDAKLTRSECQDINAAETSTEEGDRSGSSVLGDLTPSMEDKVELHNAGLCRPCSYFCFKPDGCRMGDSCEFCHLCDMKQAKERKRIFKAQAQLQRKLQRQPQSRRWEGMHPVPAMLPR